MPKFATEAAMTIQTSEAAMTIVAGAFVYVWDGTDWIELQVHPTAEPGRLIERIPLDFEPPGSS